MKSISIHDINGKNVGKYQLDEAFFNGKVNNSLLYQALMMYSANRRKASAHTKTMQDVRGGGKKPWRQKGTGRARVGSIRSPLWKGGGTVFGPKGRIFKYALPKKIRNLALIHALNGKIKDNELFIVDKIALSQPKTKEMSSMLKKLKVSNKALIVIEKQDEKLHRAARNIAGASLKPFNDINVDDVLRHKEVIFSKQALENLIKLRK